MRIHLACSLTIASLLAFGAAQSACTITTTNATDDGGVTPPVDTDSGTVDTTDSGNGDSATASLLGFTASNLGAAFAELDPTALQDVSVATTMQLASDVDQSTSLGTGAGVVYRAVTQSDGTMIGVYLARSWTFAAAAKVHVTGAYPIAFVAFDTIEIDGALDASSAGAVPGAGAGAPTTTGVGAGRGGDGTTADGAAAAGGSFCGAGGAGGKYTAAATPALGTAYGAGTLVPLVAGASGGVGSQPAGAGGGAIQLVAKNSITISSTGVLAANGGGGGPSGGVASGAVAIGSAGGSGGAILLEAPTVSVTGVLAANGGGGGGNSGSAGQDGQNTATPATGTGTGTGLGGNGSGGAVVDGTTGGAGSGASGTGNDIAPAGGGGGAGRIRINTTTGAATVTNAVLSPASGSVCLTQGTLTS